MMSRRQHLLALGGAAAAGAAAPTDFSKYTDAQKEVFLASARVVSAREVGHGVTRPVRVEMELGGVRHSAKIQTVEKDLPDFFPENGPPVPMRDSWRFNIAAYRLDRLLGLNMVVVVVPRRYQGKPAAFSWWADDVMFEEIDRLNAEKPPPDPEDFERQRALGCVFDELIINIDRNLSNLLITKSWRLVLIDHSRTFTPYPGIRNRAKLTRCSRTLFEKMKALDAAVVTRAVGPHLTPAEVRALFGRRDRIVEHFAREAQAKGESQVFFA